MSLFWPIGAEWVCVAQSERARIHAAAIVFEGEAPDRRPVPLLRTVCGIDARPVGHPVAGRPDSAVVAVWPAPIAERCEDCARITGVGGRQRVGSHSFTSERGAA